MVRIDLTKDEAKLLQERLHMMEHKRDSSKVRRMMFEINRKFENKVGLVVDSFNAYELRTGKGWLLVHLFGVFTILLIIYILTLFI